MVTGASRGIGRAIAIRLGTEGALGRVGRPEDIADAVAFLASDQGRWITGHVLDATGGLYLRPRRPITRATR